MAIVAIRHIYEYKLEIIIVMLVSPLKKAEFKEFRNETQIALKLYIQKCEFEVKMLLLNWLKNHFNI